ncbi:MAG: hypothetical protein QNJ01_13420 [Desulfobacterales bacterium]|nr:hypothetical protein [Desulfobacterales bacterium]
MTEQNAQKILMLLAREWALKGPPGILDISEIVAALALAPSDILATIKDLFARGLVDMNSLRTSVFLTPEGYAAVSAQDAGDR